MSLKKSKKRWARVAGLSGLAAAATAIGSVAAACGGVQFKSTVQVVVGDYGSVMADQSFSESAYNGLKRFYEANGVTGVPAASDPTVVENNGIWKAPTNQTDDGRVRAYENVKNDGSKIIIATGFSQGTALQRITNESAYPNEHSSLKETGFIFVDGTMTATGGSNPTNVSTISYRSDDGSFLAGVATAVYLNENWESFYTAKPETIGASGYVGLPQPTTVSYLNGFRLGLMYWNKICSLIELGDGSAGIPIKWISPTTSYTIEAFTSGSFQPNEQGAISITNELIKNGAKAILPIAGPQTALSVNIAAAHTENVAVLGVDTPQEDLASLQKAAPKPTAAVPSVIPFSTLKNITHSVYGVLESIKSGNNLGGAGQGIGYSGFGYNNVADLTNDGVGISDAGLKYLIDPLFFAAQTPDSSSQGTESETTTPVSPTSVQKDSKTYQQYDVSKLLTGATSNGGNTATASNRYKLSNLKRASATADKTGILESYNKLLTSQILINYETQSNGNNTPIATAIDWTITGDELTKNDLTPANGGTSSTPDANLPAITGELASYVLTDVFGSTVKTTQVATGTLLDGTGWTYDLTIS